MKRGGGAVHGSFCSPAAVSRYPDQWSLGLPVPGLLGRTRLSGGQHVPHLLQVCLLGLADARRSARRERIVDGLDGHERVAAMQFVEPLLALFPEPSRRCYR
jgi:hypothetical protein